MENYILSIGIATRGREQYCIAAIKSILNYKFDHIQIVIADNGDTTQVADYVASENKPFIKYIHTEEPLSFVANFDKLIAHCDGEYVTIIGDDDAVLSNILPLVYWMKKKNIHALTSSRYLSYFWPEGGNNRSQKDAQLRIPSSKNTVRYVDVQTNLREFVKAGFINYLDYDLPKIYHGIIKKEKLEDYKRITGTYFGGLTPDIYSAAALALVIDKNVIYDKPFSIAGVCPQSGSHQALSNKHIGGNIYEAPHFRNRGTYVWDNTIPPFYSVTTIWAETAMRAIKDMKMDALMNGFNIQGLYSHLLRETMVHCPEQLEECEQAIETSRKYLHIDETTEKPTAAIYSANDRKIRAKSSILKTIRWVFPNFRKGFKEYDQVNDIQSAINIIEKDGALQLNVLPE